MDDGNTNYLRLLYSLVSKNSESLSMLLEKYYKYLTESLKKLAEDCKDGNAADIKEKTMALIVFCVKIDSYLLDEFHNDPEINAVMQHALDHVLNENPISSKGLALCLDEILRCKDLGSLPCDPRVIISTSTNLFRFIKDKDIFRTNYIELLKERIEKKLYINHSLEDFVVSLLDNIADPDYCDDIDKVRDPYLETLETVRLVYFFYY